MEIAGLELNLAGLGEAPVLPTAKAPTRWAQRRDARRQATLARRNGLPPPPRPVFARRDAAGAAPANAAVPRAPDSSLKGYDVGPAGRQASGHQPRPAAEAAAATGEAPSAGPAPIRASAPGAAAAAPAAAAAAPVPRARPIGDDASRRIAESIAEDGPSTSARRPGVVTFGDEEPGQGPSSRAQARAATRALTRAGQAPGAGARARPRSGRARDPNGPPASERVGRLRLLSRANPERELTPDQDDIAAPVEDGEGEGGGLDDLVAAYVARQAVSVGELGDASAGSGGGRGDAGSSDDETYDRMRARGPEPRARKPTSTKKRAERAAAGAGGGGGAGPAFRPGALVHARTDDEGREGAGGENGGPPSSPTGSPRSPTAPEDPAERFPSSSPWSTLGVPRLVSSQLAQLGFDTPTEVQTAAVPALIARRDALVAARTGSGKTLAYLVPILTDLLGVRPRVARRDGTLALVLTPTRELALQVSDVLGALLRRSPHVVGGVLHGGEARGGEKARLRKGVTALVATPGRLADHLENTKTFRVDLLRWLVLDEADRLLDLGFLRVLREILAALDSRRAPGAGPRVTVLFSATLHNNLGSLAGLSLRDPVAVGFRLAEGEGGTLQVLEPEAADARAREHGGGGEGGEIEGGGRGGSSPSSPAPPSSEPSFDIPKSLDQAWLEVPTKLRLPALLAVLASRVARAPESAKILVFVSARDVAAYLGALLPVAWQTLAAGSRHASLPTPAWLALHGGMAQPERTRAYAAFMARGAARILVATDVAARGLDFEDVTTVLQLDPPSDIAEYVHRAGRAGRGAAKHASAEALLFLSPSERGFARRLADRGARAREAPLAQELDDALGRDPRASRGGAAGLERHRGAADLQRRLLALVGADRGLAAAGAAAFVSWVRAYATHSAADKDIFSVKSLHLGHVAHAFGLNERPSLVGGQGAAPGKKRARDASARDAAAEKRDRKEAAAAVKAGVKGSASGFHTSE